MLFKVHRFLHFALFLMSDHLISDHCTNLNSGNKTKKNNPYSWILIVLLQAFHNNKLLNYVFIICNEPALLLFVTYSMSTSAITTLTSVGRTAPSLWREWHSFQESCWCPGHACSLPEDQPTSVRSLTNQGEPQVCTKGNHKCSEEWASSFRMTPLSLIINFN